MKVTVRVPASSANLGSGTDCLGVALPLFLTVVFEEAKNLQVRFLQGTPEVPLDHNLIYRAARKIFEKAGKPDIGVNLSIESEIPLARGLGSSASALVAGVWGANAYLGYPYDENDLLAIAAELEGHPDNVVPCAVGGFTVAMPTRFGVRFTKVPVDETLRFVLAVPEYELATKRAREVLPKEVPLADSILQVQRACYLVTCFYEKCFSALEDATQDRLFTPSRRRLIPGFDRAVAAAKTEGALCAVLSGAGPSVLAIAPEADTARKVQEGMRAAFLQETIKSRIYLFEAENHGVTTVRE